ncbi:Type 1 glutamine amidotransferase-like domain-containing protein [Humibacillus xanthopallidus]|uniref:Cyanophycinase n=1 Tax=Humibacillus xanthopallidus TaxID=412689 RepID=A0A543HGN3_9MICO|nr:Type 1 glutamine amidotransferase-like domain-containing protein [Humibacillus xanthopallidus]TQM57495.1 cyanophycinase [Humibacillus xanthopallidus]
MTVFLIGGGWSDELAPEIYGGFIAAAAATAAAPPTAAPPTAAAPTAAPAARPRVLLVLMGTDEESLAYHERYLHKLELVGGQELEVVRVPEGDPVDPAVVERLGDVDGLFVGGGPTPEYHASLRPAYGRIRERVTEGMAYAGFSAGAAIAGSHAVIGGWRIDGTPVCPEDSNEELDPVTVVEGIGLVEGAVDVHAAQWGTVSRLVAVVEAGLAPHGIAIDEDTVLGPDGRVRGAGRVWHARRAESGAVTLTTTGPAGPPR